MIRTHRALGSLALWLLLVGACSSGGVTDNDPAAFCGALRAATTETGAVGSLNFDDAETVQAAVDGLATLVELAPSSIAADVAVVSDVYGEVLSTLVAAAPGGRDDALRELQPRLDDAAGPAANLERYATASCRVRFEAPAQPTPSPTPLDLED